MNYPVNCPDCGSSLDGNVETGCAACQIRLGLTDVSQPTVAAQVATIPIEELVDRFPDLEIIEMIGVGGMGAVYRARQKKLDRIVAIKIVRPDISESDEFAQRFEREAKAMARLNHPNIVSIHDFGQSDGIYYYLMELVDGPNLAELAKSEQLTPSETLEIVTQVCQAMQYAHDNGVVHRDIKPTNILLNAEGAVKIADFGLAKLCAAGDPTTHLTQTKQVFGTPRYMAPEQIEATREVDHRADIYSLGVVFYELLTGELPLGRFDPPSHKISVDVRLDEVVLRALEKHPERRYQAAREFQTDISELVQPVPPVKNSNVAAMSTAGYLFDEPQKHRHGWLVAALVIPGTFLALLGGFLLSIWIATEFFDHKNYKARPPVFYLAPFALLAGWILLAVGGWISYRGLPEKKLAELRGRSPVKRVFNFRNLIYAVLVISLVTVSLPWIQYGNWDSGIDYVFGFQIWHGWAAAALLILGIPLLIFIDVYEGIGLQFLIALAVLAGICLAMSIDIVSPQGRYASLPQSIVQELRDSQPKALPGPAISDPSRIPKGVKIESDMLGAAGLLIASNVLVVLAVFGLLRCGLNHLTSPSVKQSTGRVISKTGGTLVQWADRLSEIVRGKD